MNSAMDLRWREQGLVALCKEFWTMDSDMVPEEGDKIILELNRRRRVVMGRLTVDKSSCDAIVHILQQFPQVKLQAAAEIYIEASRKLYHNIIWKAMQDSTRQTLESIVAAQQRQQQQLQEREDTSRLMSVVQVLNDRQKILTKELTLCYDTFVACRKEYEEFQARVRRLSVYVDLLVPKKTVGNSDHDNLVLLAELRVAKARVTQEAQTVDAAAERQLRELRKAYSLNQPSMPVTVL